MVNKIKAGITILLFTGLALVNADIPHIAALKRANITLTSIDNLQTKSLLIGNGSIQGLIWSKGTQVVMRISKNEAWDGRLITEQDPTGIPTVDITSHSWSGQPHPPSWNNPYPTQIYIAEFVIGEIGNNLQATIHLEKGIAEINSSAGNIKVRALMDKDLFLVETPFTIYRYHVDYNFLPTATTVDNSGNNMLVQNFPAGGDFPGMLMYVGNRAGGNRKYISVYSSLEDPDAETYASHQLLWTLGDNFNQIISRSEDSWNSYWSKSGVVLNDRELERWWYRTLYWLRCFSKPGVLPFGTKAGLDELPKEHGAYNNIYGMWQGYWSSLSSNRILQFQPLLDFMNKYHPRAKHFATEGYGLEGAALPDKMFPYDSDPSSSNSKNKGMLARFPEAYSMGVTGQVALSLWQYFLFTGDKWNLENNIYPLLKDYALFYADYFETCQKENGKAIVGPSYDPYHGTFGIDNSPYDISLAKGTLSSAIKAAGILEVDSQLVARWESALTLVPDYSSQNNVVVNWKGGAVSDITNYEIPTISYPVFPSGDVSWFSPDADKNLFVNTINYLEGKVNENRSTILLNGARARMSMTSKAFSGIKTFYGGTEVSNGFFVSNTNDYFLSEHMGLSGLISELLLQSNDNIVRLFPAYPNNENAQFTDLRAQGGYLISAEKKSGNIGPVTIKSEVDGELKLLSPWKRISGTKNTENLDLTMDLNSIVTVQTEAGDSLVFEEDLTSVEDRRFLTRNKIQFQKLIGNRIVFEEKYRNLEKEVTVYNLAGVEVVSVKTNRLSYVFPEGVLNKNEAYLVRVGL